MQRTTSLSWKAYGALIHALSFLHYVVLSPLSRSDEGGWAWLRKRIDPALPKAARGPRVWIHAVSAGESKVAELLRREVLALDHRISVVLSSTTYSGYARVRAAAGEAESFVMPLDTIEAQRRVFETVRPDLLVLVESEYWPAQFAAAAEAGVPVVVVNATLSERSYARHRQFPGVARATMLRAARIYPQDEATERRYLKLGVPADRLEVAGNLKLAAPLPGPGEETARDIAVTFGNVHEAEIASLAPAIAVLRARRPDIRILLVPRYPGKVPDERLREALGADLQIVDDPTRIDGRLVWMNRMGVLGDLYARSLVGVVCGTFAPIGGHDLSEPLQRGAASVYGPRVERQRALHAALRSIDGAIQVADAALLASAIDGLLEDPAGREAMVSRFTEVSEAAAGRLRVVAATLVGMAKG